MNDNDIQLITALVAGELSAAEQGDVMSRIESDTELRAAYDEQVAVSSALMSAPAVSMTAAEAGELRAALRTELQLEGAVVAAAATAPWWSRWWAPVTGLATAAVIVFAFVIVPNLGDEPEDVLSAPAEATTLAPSALVGPSAVEGTTQQQSADNGESDATSSAAESAPEEPNYRLAATPQGSELELPLLDEESVEDSGVDSARSEATSYAELELDDVSACFAKALANWPPISTSLVGITPDGESVIGTAIDPVSGDEVLLYINLTTCAVTAAE
jgi:hypothetical protein